MKPCGFNFLFLQIGLPNTKDCIRILLSFVNVVNHGCEKKNPIDHFLVRETPYIYKRIIEF